MAAGRKRTVELEFTVDDSDVKRGVANVDKNTASISSKLSKAGTAIKIGFAAAAASGVATGIKSLADLAVAAEGIERRFETVFGNTSESMSNWIDEQNEAFGVSEVQLKGMAAGIQDLLVPMGFARSEAAGMTQQILETANALSEWTGGAVSTEQAIDAVAKAMLGEREQLKGLGVAIKEADVKAELARMGLDGLTGAALEQAKAQATLNLILGKSKDALDAYADGADSAARSQKELNGRLADAKQELADRFLPVWTDFVESMADATSGLGGLNRQIERGPLDWFDKVSGIDAVTEALMGANREIEGTGFRWRNMGDVTDSWARVLPELKRGLEGVVTPLDAFNAGLERQATLLGALVNPLSTYGGLISGLLSGQFGAGDVIRANELLEQFGITEPLAPGAVTRRVNQTIGTEDRTRYLNERAQ